MEAIILKIMVVFKFLDISNVSEIQLKIKSLCKNWKKEKRVIQQRFKDAGVYNEFYARFIRLLDNVLESIKFDHQVEDVLSNAL